jgi:hypothetical protein
MDDSMFDHIDKRLRNSGFESMSQSPGGLAAEDGANAAASTGASTQSWAEAIVKSLHGCPSVDEAVQRCALALANVEADVRRATAKEFETPEVQQSDVLQAAQNKGRVLMRAVKHLAERCKRLEGACEHDEVAHLRQALVKSQEEQRRLRHSNELLMSHLRLHLGDCRNGVLPWDSQ